MPRSKPKMLSSYPADWVLAVKNAMLEPHKPFTLLQGNGETAYLNTRAKLVAMRNGIKLYEPKDSAMQRAAMTQNLTFRKAEPIGDYDWRLTVTFLGLRLRPSEEYAELVAGWMKNASSSDE